MDKPKKITGWSCSVLIFEEFFSRMINPDEVKETVTLDARNRVVQNIAGEYEEFRLCEQEWA